MHLIELSDKQKKEIKKIELDTLIVVDKICKENNITYWLGYGTLLGSVRHNGFIPWDDDIDICMPRADFEKFRKICVDALPKNYFYQSHYTDKNYYHLFDKIRVNNTSFVESHVAGIDMNHGVYIDVFPIDYLAKGTFQSNVQFLKCRVLRAILYSKFLNIEARSGKKKLAAIILRVLFKPFSKSFLWERAEKSARIRKKTPKYKCGCFFSPYGKKDFYPVSAFQHTIEWDFEGYKFRIPQKYHRVLSRLYGDYMKLPPKEKRKTIHDIVNVSTKNYEYYKL